ncbi:MAG: DUF2892 domain-containing protein [Candidatus Omnitrophica bacterium]|nr:DUF2892 domain-containing protein [Candidatus Omnitrophota bacterium]
MYFICFRAPKEDHCRDCGPGRADARRGWLLFTVFIGVNLLQSAFTNWCLMMNILKKLGFK